VTALGKLRFINDGTISFDVTITGNQTKLWTARIYSRGSCAAVLNWVANRNAATDPAGYLDVMSNAGEVQHQLVTRDVNRVRAALGRGESLALMVAGTDNAGATYRTCTAFTATAPPTTTLPPITTSVTTTQTTPTTVTTTTGSSTNTTVTTTTSQTTQTSTSIGVPTELCVTLTLTGELPFTPTFTLPPIVTTTITTTNTTGSTVTLTQTSVPVTTVCIGNNM
jgi:hypothetical protein